MGFFQNMANIKAFLEQEDLEALKLKAVSDEFTAAFNALDTALKPFRKSGLTEGIAELDRRRDMALVGFAAHCRLFATFPDADKAAAAARLLLTLDKYGKAPQDKPAREETAIIYNLLQDLDEAPATADIGLIGATQWVTDLRTANTAYEKSYNDRTQHDAAVITGATKEARVAMYEVFRKLVQTINALAFLGGAEPYARLIDNINMEVRRAQQALKQRLSGNVKDEEPETDELLPDEEEEPVG